LRMSITSAGIPSHGVCAVTERGDGSGAKQWSRPANLVNVRSKSFDRWVVKFGSLVGMVGMVGVTVRR